MASAASAAGLTSNPNPGPLTTATINANGVFPALTATADSAPGGPLPRSECGIGAMMAWNDLLYYVSYLSVPDAGNGTGLYAIDQNMNQVKLASHTSVYANRMLIPAMNSIVIGPYVIDGSGGIRTITGLLNVRIGGMAEHIFYPNSSVYMLSMDGPLYEVNLLDLSVKQLFNLTETLNIPIAQGEQPHFKAAHTMNGTLYIGSNTFEELDYVGAQHGGRLASWNGDMSTPWTILEETAFCEVTGRHNMGRTVFAMGWDDASVILKVIDYGQAIPDPSYDTAVQTYRLPKASHAYDHLWTTEWPRIREIESERYLMDMHGQFYELAAFTWGGAAWGIKPISQHLRMIPDYASYRGFLVLGGNQVSSIFDNNWVTGQSQSGLWWGTSDGLWGFGKPQGWGGPWRYDAVPADTPSDAYLMTGFDKKVVHFRVDPPAASFAARKPRSQAAKALAKAGGVVSAAWPPANNTVTFSIEIDFTGSAGHRGAYGYMEPWNPLASVQVTVDPIKGGYAYYSFPAAFSAHWVRFTVDQSCNCTAQLTYT